MTVSSRLRPRLPGPYRHLAMKNGRLRLHCGKSPGNPVAGGTAPVGIGYVRSSCRAGDRAATSSPPAPVGPVCSSRTFSSIRNASDRPWRFYASLERSPSRAPGLRLETSMSTRPLNRMAPAGRPRRSGEAQSRSAIGTDRRCRPSVSRSAVEGRRQCFRCGRSSQAGPEAELPVQ
jgi:hypothetical protein